MLGKIWELVVTKIQTAAPEALGRLGMAILILIAGLVVGKICTTIIRQIFTRSGLRQKVLVRNLTLKSTRVAVYVVTIIMAIEKLGVDVTPFIAGLGMSSLVIGFAFKDTLSNFASGLLLVIYEPFRAGDAVNIDGTAGVIQAVNLVNTHVIGFDGLDIYLPNTNVWGSKIINYSRCPYRRSIFDIGVAYGADMSKVVGILQEILDTDPRILKQPASFIRVGSLADSAVVFQVFVNSAPADFGSVLNDFYKIAKEKLDDAGIEIPFPQLDLNLPGSAAAQLPEVTS